MRRVGLQGGRAFDRFINFTDAVVAIALTLMVLPLINIAGPEENETVWMVLSANSGAIIAYLMAFAIVSNSWLQHNQLVNDMRAYNGAIFWLNTAWLALIAMIPWSANLYGNASDRFEGGEGLGGTGLFFWILMTLITLVGLVISRYVNKHSELLDNDRAAQWRQRRVVGDAISITLIVTFMVIGVATIFIPTISSFLPQLIFPVARIAASRARRQASGQET